MVEKSVAIPAQLLASIAGYNPISKKNQGGDPLNDAGGSREEVNYTPSQIEEIKQHNEMIERETQRRRQESAQKIINNVYQKHLEKREAEKKNLQQNEQTEEEKETPLSMSNRKRRFAVHDQGLTLNEPDTLPSDQPDITNQQFQQPSENPLMEQPADLFEAEPDERIRLIHELSDEQLANQIVRIAPQQEQQGFRQYLTELGSDFLRFQLIGSRAEGISDDRVAKFQLFNQVVQFLFRQYLKSREKGAIVDKPYSPSEKPIEDKLTEFKQLSERLPPQCKSEIFVNPRTKMPEMVVTCKFVDERRPRIYRQY